MSSVSSALTTVQPFSGRLRAFPFIPSKNITLDQIAFNVTTAQAGNARVGIYNDDGNLYPSSLVIDGGEQATGVVGVKVSVIEVPVLAGKLYWLAQLASVAVAVRGLQIGSCIPILGLDSLLGTTPGLGWDVAFNYGALPVDYPAGAVPWITAAPAIFVRGS
jgi:hypothetical protein